ncbi:TPA: hypothetical protein PTW06_003640 [Clostridium botulinum]|nr:hypothetical protein [Clostridium botulinum]HDK7226207.1 hypothetical protein [Clostridium botulinum]HDK7273700.1 hypothetical protein [Clostridium botulinum]HDK7307048.1 hypothetical protein [Clostridium botulinum]
MNFISTEEFLKQPKKVQNIFKNWWKPQAGDLVHDKINIVGVIVPALCIGDYKSNLDKSKVTPLFQMHQLIEFIEDKTSCKIINIYYFNKKNCYSITLENNEIAKTIESSKNNLLYALWEVACNIAEYEV